MTVSHHCPLKSKGGCRSKNGHCAEHQTLCSQHNNWTLKGRPCLACIAQKQADQRKKKADEQTKKKEAEKEKEKKDWDNSFGQSEKNKSDKNKKKKA